MDDSQINAIFARIDTTGSARRDDPGFGEVEKEMIRSHALCLEISAKKPTDPDYKGLLEELLGREIDPGVAIVSPFYCDCGCRLAVGKTSSSTRAAPRPPTFLLS